MCSRGRRHCRCAISVSHAAGSIKGSAEPSCDPIKPAVSYQNTRGSGPIVNTRVYFSECLRLTQTVQGPCLAIPPKHGVRLELTDNEFTFAALLNAHFVKIQLMVLMWVTDSEMKVEMKSLKIQCFL